MPSSSGVRVRFIDDITETGLWMADMLFAPGENATLSHTDASAVTRDYEVNSVGFEFNSPVPVGEDSPIACQHTLVVRVTEV